MPVSVSHLCIVIVHLLLKAEMVTDFQVEKASARKHSWTELFQGNRGTGNKKSSDEASGRGSIAS